MQATRELKQRKVSKIVSPEVVSMSPFHRLRPLVPPGNWAETDPFLLLVEDWFVPGAFDDHPHKGFETVTYVLEGKIDHFDNHGNRGSIGPGEALWLTAGRGIVHNEVPNPDVHLLQLWINLPRVSKNVHANYQELKKGNIPKRQLLGAEVAVLTGRSGDVQSPTVNHAQITMIDARLEPHAVFKQELPAYYNGFVVVLGGEGKVGTTPVAEGEVAWLKREAVDSQVRFEGGDRGSRLMLYAGLPLNEPVVARGPFVMNSEAEIVSAYEDYREQREQFGLRG